MAGQLVVGEVAYLFKSATETVTCKVLSVDFSVDIHALLYTVRYHDSGGKRLEVKVKRRRLSRCKPRMPKKWADAVIQQAMLKHGGHAELTWRRKRMLAEMPKHGEVALPQARVMKIYPLELVPWAE